MHFQTPHFATAHYHTPHFLYSGEAVSVGAVKPGRTLSATPTNRGFFSRDSNEQLTLGPQNRRIGVGQIGKSIIGSGQSRALSAKGQARLAAAKTGRKSLSTTRSKRRIKVH